MSYTRAEMETTIVWDDAEKLARVYTSSPSSIRKLDKMCAAHPEEYRRVWTETNGGRVTAARYEMPSKRVRYGHPKAQSAEDAEFAENMA